MAKNPNMDPEICAVPRWQQIKSTLNNLDYKTFVQRANENSENVIIDVRTPEEHEQVSIPGSQILNYLDQDLADKVEKLPIDKNYYVYCRTGRRSLRVCVIMRNLGFKNVYNLEGGIVSGEE